MVVLETNRLVLREFELTDAKDCYFLNADPEVMKYTGDSAFASVPAAENFLKAYDHYQKHGFGRWAVILKSDQQFLGWCGLKRHEDLMVDLGFRFFRNQWGNGYATEASMACLNYGFNHLNLQKIIGRASQENKASIRVLEKIGMRFWKYDECKGIENSAYYMIAKEHYKLKPLG